MASVTEQLKDLVELRKEGVLTPEEFEEQKEILLAEARARASTPPAAEPSTLAADPSDLTGQRIGEYRLERKLGEGGMGQVYLGAHETLAQRVAVKVLHSALARDEELRRRFVQEANLQIQLEHPGIVKVLTANTGQGPLALVMEYVDGEGLDARIERERRLPEAVALPIFRRVLAAVGYAHAQGVVHRDLKPANVLLKADGTPRITDFGIAKVMGSTKLTRTGSVMGSVHYMAPEQVLGRPEIDRRADIYALGAVLYEMLTGCPPFADVDDPGGDSDFRIREAQIHATAPDPRGRVPDLSPAVAAAIATALQKAPEVRFSTCERFANALETSASNPSLAPRGTAQTVVEPVHASPPPVAVAAPPSTPPPEAWRESQPGGGRGIAIAVAGVGGIALLVTVLVVAAALSRDPAPSAVSPEVTPAPLVADPNPPTPEPVDPEAEVERTVRSLFEGWFAAHHPIRPDEISAYYHSEVHYYSQVGASPSEVRASKAKAADKFVVFEMTWRDLHVEVVGTTRVVLTYEKSWHERSTSGREREGKVAAVLVWQLQDGTWGIVEERDERILCLSGSTKYPDC